MNSQLFSKAREASALAFIAALVAGCSGGTQGTSAKVEAEASTRMAKIGVSFQDEESVIALKANNTKKNAAGAPGQSQQDNQQSQDQHGPAKENATISSVMVNIASIELKVSDGDGPWMSLGKPAGAVDLMKLKNGFPLPVSEGELEIGTKITEIRLVLEEEGNFLTNSDGSVCDLKTPSAQQSGLKLKLESPVVAEADHSYSILFDFDTRKSIVIQGNGGCLLKPVLKKVKINSEIVYHEPDDSTGSVGDDDGSQGGDDSSGSVGDDNSSGGTDSSDGSTGSGDGAGTDEGGSTGTDGGSTGGDSAPADGSGTVDPTPTPSPTPSPTPYPDVPDTDTSF